MLFFFCNDGGYLPKFKLWTKTSLTTSASKTTRNACGKLGSAYVVVLCLLTALLMRSTGQGDQVTVESCSEFFTVVLNAVKSSGPTRQRRIGIAARWYLGIPQIFLRDPGRGSIRNAEIIQLRLSNFLEGNYATVLNDWSAAKAKARKKAKLPKADTHAHRIDRCIKLFHQGFLSRGLRILTGNGRADADDPKIIRQMQEKHPTEDWSHAQ